jgi:hypothetical protein
VYAPTSCPPTLFCVQLTVTFVPEMLTLGVLPCGRELATEVALLPTARDPVKYALATAADSSITTEAARMMRFGERREKLRTVCIRRPSGRR